MKAYELRLGNWVECKGVHYQIFDGLGTFVIKGLCNLKANKVLIDVPLLSLNSIPITEEILLKCGFEKYAGWFILKSIYTHLDININLLINKLTIGRNEEYEIDHFKSHLHELQNLYFALTGEELKIDL